jgi:Phage terminase large subunit
MVANAISGDDRKVAYIAPTYQQARDIAWQDLKRNAQNIATNINESRLEITVRTIKGGSSQMYLRGWEAVDSLRGNRFDFLVLDEVASYRGFWTGWHEVLRPTLTDTKGQALFIGTPKGFNHFYDLYNIVDDDYRSFHFTSYDNPFIPSDEIDKAKKEVTEDRFAQEYLADFRKTSGLVYPEFDRTRHVTDAEPTQVTDTMAGIDWGYTNPASSHRIRVDGDRHYWIDDEFYKTGQTTDQIIEAVKLKKPTKVYPDPAEPDRIEMARRAGLNVREVSKDIEAGIDTVRELLKQNRIHVHPSCVNLISEFETYRYPEKKSDQNEKETPIKENDHALDEIRYVLHNQEPIVEVLADPYFEKFGTYYKD